MNDVPIEFARMFQDLAKTLPFHKEEVLKQLEDDILFVEKIADPASPEDTRSLVFLKYMFELIKDKGNFYTTKKTNSTRSLQNRRRNRRSSRRSLRKSTRRSTRKSAQRGGDLSSFFRNPHVLFVLVFSLVYGSIFPEVLTKQMAIAELPNFGLNYYGVLLTNGLVNFFGDTVRSNIPYANTVMSYFAEDNQIPEDFIDIGTEMQKDMIPIKMHENVMELNQNILNADITLSRKIFSRVTSLINTKAAQQHKKNLETTKQAYNLSKDSILSTAARVLSSGISNLFGSETKNEVNEQFQRELLGNATMQLAVFHGSEHLNHIAISEILINTTSTTIPVVNTELSLALTPYEEGNNTQQSVKFLTDSLNGKSTNSFNIVVNEKRNANREVMSKYYDVGAYFDGAVVPTNDFLRGILNNSITIPPRILTEGGRLTLVIPYEFAEYMSYIHNILEQSEMITFQKELIMDIMKYQYLLILKNTLTRYITDTAIHEAVTIRDAFNATSAYNENIILNTYSYDQKEQLKKATRLIKVFKRNFVYVTEKAKDKILECIDSTCPTISEYEFKNKLKLAYYKMAIKSNEFKLRMIFKRVLFAIIAGIAVDATGALLNFIKVFITKLIYGAPGEIKQGIVTVYTTSQEQQRQKRESNARIEQHRINTEAATRVKEATIEAATRLQEAEIRAKALERALQAQATRGTRGTPAPQPQSGLPAYQPNNTYGQTNTLPRRRSVFGRPSGQGTASMALVPRPQTLK